jgi:hypothetical protein
MRKLIGFVLAIPLILAISFAELRIYVAYSIQQSVRQIHATQSDVGHLIEFANKAVRASEQSRPHR